VKTVNNVLKQLLSHELALRVRREPQGNGELKQIPFAGTRLEKTVIG